MSQIRLGPLPTLLVGAVSCLPIACASSGPVVASHARASPGTDFPAHLLGRSISVSGDEDTGPIEIYLERWSTDEELDKVLGTLAESGPGELLDVLERQRVPAGVMLLPGVQGHGERVRTPTPKRIQFAREIVTPAGRQVILASDERLGVGESQLDARKKIYEFTLMDIRFGPDGTGVGKIAAAGDVVYNPETKILELKDYDTKPVRLTNVKSAMSKRP
ncbi:MAG: hypothetical protein E6J85_11265 [Deltaproteobacteria bacterium]|nr:MAG: hypothetical protein E6J85_11265 [Deltaproteobacteria bacterium]